MNIHKKIISAVLLLLSVVDLCAEVKGSDTVVSIEPAYTFLAADNDNTMLGFGWFKNGFSLEDSLTTCTFNSVYPVSGSVNCNGGTLTLTQDLIFQNITDLQGLGDIVGNGYKIELCDSITAFPPDTSSFKDVHVLFHGHVSSNSSITFKGSCVFSGHGGALVLESGAEIIVDSGATLELRDLDIIGTHTNNIRCVDDTSKIILHNINWVQVDDFVFDTGSILFEDQVNFLGNSIFNYTSGQTSTIAKNSELRVSDYMHFCLGRDSGTQNEPLAFVDRSSVLKCDNCFLIISPTGVQWTKGAVVFDRNVEVDIMSTASSTSLHVGNGVEADDLVIYYTPSTQVRINQGHFYYDNVGLNSMQSPSVTAQLRRGTGSYVTVAQSLILPSITVVLETNFVPPISVNSGIQFSYDNARIILPLVEFDIASSQYGLFAYLLNGATHYLDIARGSFPLALFLDGVGASIRGNGSIIGPVALVDSDAQADIDFAGFIGNAMTLNGGKASLKQDLLLSAAGSIVGPGMVDLSVHTLKLSPTEINWTTPLAWKGVTGNIDIKAKLALSSTWTVSGTCVINGNGNTLDLSGGGEIVVDTNSQVQFKNIRLQGVQDSNIRCVDDSGSILFLNTQWEQSGDYILSNGSMKFIRDNYFSGAYTFTYDSSQTSTINSNSSLVITNDLNFAIGRKDAFTTVEPLYFSDLTSVFELDNSKFTVQSNGIMLTRGKMFATRDAEIDILSTSTSNGLQFGDGTVDGNMKLNLNPGCSARYTGGHATMHVTTNDPIRSTSNTARIIRSDSSVFYLKNSVTLSDVTVDVSPYSSLIIGAGDILDYSNSRIVLAQGTFDLSGTRYNNYTTLLGGNDKINILDGSLPLVTLVQSTGNSIEGNGHITGPVVLQDSNAQLTCALNGFVYAPITLNTGTLALGNDLNLGNNITLSGSGSVVLNGSNINSGKAATTWAGSIDWDGTSGGSLNLRAQVDLTGTWTFNGVCDIKGDGNSLNLGATGEIVVGPNSILTLHNLSLENISDTNIRCVDDTGIIILDGVHWGQSANNYLFSNGTLSFKNKVTMRGSGVFVYSSDMASTIAAETELKFDEGFTFSYGPTSTQQDLLQFTDDTSQLLLQGASLHSTSTGMVLTKGMLLVQGNCNLSCDVTADGNGITFGDGVDDMIVQVGPGSQLNVAQGTLSYKNLNANAWRMINGISVLNMSDDTALQLYESLHVGVGVVRFNNNITFARASGKTIIGSINMAGKVTFTTL